MRAWKKIARISTFFSKRALITSDRANRIASFSFWSIMWKFCSKKWSQRSQVETGLKHRCFEDQGAHPCHPNWIKYIILLSVLFFTLWGFNTKIYIPRRRKVNKIYIYRKRKIFVAFSTFSIFRGYTCYLTFCTKEIFAECLNIIVEFAKIENRENFKCFTKFTNG